MTRGYFPDPSWGPYLDLLVSLEAAGLVAREAFVIVAVLAVALVIGVTGYFGTRSADPKA